MQKIILLLSIVLLTSGCATVQSPVNGWLYTDIKSPLALGESNARPNKVGRASVTSYMGLVTTGDASIQSAMKQAGITKIHFIDYESRSFMGVYSEFTAVVYGE